MVDTALEEALYVFTKPARPGRVKTRLIGDLEAEQTAALHAAFRDDLLERLTRGAFHLEIAWALQDDEPVPQTYLPGHRQEGADLGARLHHTLAAGSERFAAVAAVGSDHPELSLATVEDAFHRLDAGADLVLGPVPDGGYFLIALRQGAVHHELFEGIAWSTETVFGDTLERAGKLGLLVDLLPEGQDIDRPDDLEKLIRRLGDIVPGSLDDCPRTRALLVSWGHLDPASSP